MDTTILLISMCGLLFLWCVLLTVLIAREQQFLKNLAKGVTKKDLVSVLKQIVDSLKSASTKIEASEQEIDKLQFEARKHFQKIGFIRFNPFEETGGDQSFCLCLLDGQDDGIVITSLHSRESTRLYTNTVEKSTMKAANFSKEEWQAIQAAIKLESNTK